MTMRSFDLKNRLRIHQSKSSEELPVPFSVRYASTSGKYSVCTGHGIAAHAPSHCLPATAHYLKRVLDLFVKPHLLPG